MIRIFFFISLLLNLIFPDLTSNNEASATAFNQQQADILIKVSTLNGIEIGSKVINNGLVVGIVAFVDKSKENFSIIGVNLVQDTLNLLPAGTIGLIKSPMTIDPANRQTILEFITPIENTSKNIEKGVTIKGFSSFEEFWKADLGKSSSLYEAFSLT